MDITKDDLRDILHCLAVTSRTKYAGTDDETQLMDLHQRISNMMRSEHHNRKNYVIN
jgi:hypothetical protein